MIKLTLLKIKGYLAIFAFLALAKNAGSYSKDEIGQLVRSAQEGNNEAFESLYKIFSDSIYRYLYYMMSNQETAYDLTSKVFLKAYENLKSYRFKGYFFSAWLYKIAHNVAIDDLRSLKRRAPETTMESMAEPAANVAEESFEEALIDRMTVEAALRQLTEKQRQVMILKYIEQMSNDQIGQILGKTTSAVKALEQRALSDLKDIILLQQAKERDAKKEEAYASR